MDGALLAPEVRGRERRAELRVVPVCVAIDLGRSVAVWANPMRALTRTTVVAAKATGNACGTTGDQVIASGTSRPNSVPVTVTDGERAVGIAPLGKRFVDLVSSAPGFVETLVWLWDLCSD